MSGNYNFNNTRITYNITTLAYSARWFAFNFEDTVKTKIKKG